MAAIKSRQPTRIKGYTLEEHYRGGVVKKYEAGEVLPVDITVTQPDGATCKGIFVAWELRPILVQVAADSWILEFRRWACIHCESRPYRWHSTRAFWSKDLDAVYGTRNSQRPKKWYFEPLKGATIPEPPELPESVTAGDVFGLATMWEGKLDAQGLIDGFANSKKMEMAFVEKQMAAAAAREDE